MFSETYTSFRGPSKDYFPASNRAQAPSIRLPNDVYHPPDGLTNVGLTISVPLLSLAGTYARSSVSITLLVPGKAALRSLAMLTVGWWRADLAIL